MGLTFDDIKDEFVTAVRTDKKAVSLASAAAAGTANYRDASLYAVRVGDLLGRVLKRHAPMVDISEWDLEQLIPSALGVDHAMVAEVCVQVQTAMNTANGYGIRAVEPKFDGNRAYGLVEELKNNPEFVNIEALFYDQLTNFSQSVVDQSIRDNAELQWKSGIKAYVIRETDSEACPWCMALAGTYNYEDVRDKGNDVWRRHDNCRCTIEYYNGRGGRDLVSSQYYRNRGSGSPRMRHPSQNYGG